MPPQPKKNPGSRSQDGTPRSIESPALLILGIVFLLILVRTAWVSDDAYITLRTVDNFVHGYGPTWNTDERVQAYTHPLWMLGLSFLYFFTHEAFYTTIFLCVAVSVVAFWLVVKGMPGPGLASMAILLVLVLSKAFMDYSTSGLENPATHLLLAAFLLLYLSPHDLPDRKALLTLSIVAGLATLNRMDTFLIYLPALFYLVWQQRSWSSIRILLLGFLPFILWEIFSIIYYGFPFPNPAYAKLTTGLGELQLLEQGYLYFLNSLNWDPISLVIITAALVLTFRSGNWHERTIGLGVVLYLTYVWLIGGDFMSGRFLTACVLAAVVLLERRVRSSATQTGAVVMILVVALGLRLPGSALGVVDRPSFPPDFAESAGIADERAFYFQTSSLLSDRRDAIQPHSPDTDYGLTLRLNATKVVADRRIGYMGYFAGPQVHVVDPLGLADPLLARMIPTKDPDWRIGHLQRAIPDGYLESLKRDRNLIVDPALALYYDQIRLVTRGPLWSAARFAAIWRMNTGQPASSTATAVP